LLVVYHPTIPSSTSCNLTIASVSLSQYSSIAARFLTISSAAIIPCAIVAKVTRASSPIAVGDDIGSTVEKDKHEFDSMYVDKIKITILLSF
jgi:hypothetical protein